MSTSSVSVILPLCEDGTYRTFLPELIESCRRQNGLHSLELIIATEKQSTAPELLPELISPSGQSRLRDEGINIIICESNPIGACNYLSLAKNCSGKFIAILQGGDLWTVSDKLARQADFLSENNDVDACITDFIYFDESTGCFLAPGITDADKYRFISPIDLLSENWTPILSASLYRTTTFLDYLSSPGVFRSEPAVSFVIRVAAQGRLAFMPGRAVISRIKNAANPQQDGENKTHKDLLFEISKANSFGGPVFVDELFFHRQESGSLQ